MTHPVIDREELLARRTWRTIDSVPKDGTTVLVYFAGRLRKVMACAWESGSFSDPENCMWHIDDNKFGPYPVRGYSEGDDTHWMPLPSPPVLPALPENPEAK